MKPTAIQTGEDSPTAKTGTKVLLLCGLLASLLYSATDLLASLRWYEGYSFADQNYSELAAIGSATTRLAPLTKPGPRKL